MCVPNLVKENSFYKVGKEGGGGKAGEGGKNVLRQKRSRMKFDIALASMGRKKEEKNTGKEKKATKLVSSV